MTKVYTVLFKSAIVIIWNKMKHKAWRHEGRLGSSLLSWSGLLLVGVGHDSRWGRALLILVTVRRIHVARQRDSGEL